jgi:hypothetical protein
MLKLNKYSIGIGDRFAHQAAAQLIAVRKALELGVEVTPVWNKSYREHEIIGSDPAATRATADQAVQQLKWDRPYFIDADHINLNNVDHFMNSSDFFTIDVADYIGIKSAEDDIKSFLNWIIPYQDELKRSNISEFFHIDTEAIIRIAQRYLYAVNQAGNIYRHIEKQKGQGNFITEVSMDETDDPQSPAELLMILAALAYEGIPASTIAPKFSGCFNKGVDYAGDLEHFSSEFHVDIVAIQAAIKLFNLPSDLKLSIHSGSDKFSIYPIMKAAIRKHDTGLHVKTAGTTWLEELIGLAAAGGEGLLIAKEIYENCLQAKESLMAPYRTVIDIDQSRLPDIKEVKSWNSHQFTSALRHDPGNPQYNMHFRQLLHVGYKIAAQLGDRYLNALVEYQNVISKNVTENLFERHLQRLFL